MQGEIQCWSLMGVKELIYPAFFFGNISCRYHKHFYHKSGIGDAIVKLEFFFHKDIVLVSKFTP